MSGEEPLVGPLRLEEGGRTFSRRARGTVAGRIAVRLRCEACGAARPFVIVPNDDPTAAVYDVYASPCDCGTVEIRLVVEGLGPSFSI